MAEPLKAGRAQPSPLPKPTKHCRREAAEKQGSERDFESTTELSYTALLQGGVWVASVAS